MTADPDPDELPVLPIRATGPALPPTAINAVLKRYPRMTASQASEFADDLVTDIFGALGDGHEVFVGEVVEERKLHVRYVTLDERLSSYMHRGATD